MIITTDEIINQNTDYTIPKPFKLSLNFRLFRHSYHLIIKTNYCGATATNIKPREGESWLRGSDLRDGKLYKLPLVLWDIICYEFHFGRWSLKNNY